MKKSNGRKKVRPVFVNLPPDSRKRLAEMAEREKRPVANLARVLIEEALTRREQAEGTAA